MWKIINQNHAVHSSGIEIRGEPIPENTDCYVDGDKMMTLWIDHGSRPDGPPADYGITVLGPEPLRWDDGTLLTKEESAKFRHYYTEGAMALSADWVEFDIKSE